MNEIKSTKSKVAFILKVLSITGCLQITAGISLSHNFWLTNIAKNIVTYSKNVTQNVLFNNANKNEYAY